MTTWRRPPLAFTVLAACAAGSAVLAAGFDAAGQPRGATPEEVGAGGAPGAGAGAGTVAGGDALAAKRLAALRKKVLKDEDFAENEDSNRDPFHSYLRIFVDHGPSTKSRKIPAVFDKVGLEELTLIGIVSGDDSPRAMFRDASGFGQSVKKGDFLSRTAARVTKILSDRVIVEMSDTSGTGEARVVERAILVHPDEAP